MSKQCKNILKNVYLNNNLNVVMVHYKYCLVLFMKKLEALL